LNNISRVWEGIRRVYKLIFIEFMTFMVYLY
jgi:hypothetical protein